MQIPIQIDVGGQYVFGMLHLPRKKVNPLRVVVMCYGLNGNRVENNRMTVFFGRKAEESGIAFCRFDYRGLGVSEGEFWNTSVQTKVEDVLAVVHHIKACFRDERIQIFALGYSDGVRIVLDLIERIKDIVGICLWSPILYTLIDNAHGRHARKFVREPNTGSLVLPHRGLWMGKEYLKQQIYKGDEPERLKKFLKPCMAFFGGNDPLTIKTRDRMIEMQNCERRDIEIAVVDGADHLFSRVSWSEQVIDKTLDWVLRQMRIQ